MLLDTTLIIISEVNEKKWSQMPYIGVFFIAELSPQGKVVLAQQKNYVN